MIDRVQKASRAESYDRLDQETRLGEDDHHSIRLWLRLLTCSSLIESHIRNSLREEFQTTLPRFDFMSQLQRVPEGMTMGEVSERMMVSGGNISGIATQLVKEGLVSRTALPEDRRTFLVKLTPKGLKAFNAMAARHEEWVISLIGDIDEQDVKKLMELLSKVKKTVAESADF